jgi:hypothetical protein
MARRGWAVTVFNYNKESEMYFSRKTKQRIIDDYLNETGRNRFIPEEFINWLQHKPDHEMYDAFFGMDDSEAAHKWRVHQATLMVTGMRINQTVNVEPTKSTTFKVVEKKASREYPAYISPVARRKDGGGFDAMDPENETHQAELRRQAGNKLTNWLARYRGCAEHVGVDLQPVEHVALILRGEEPEELSA